MLRRSFAREMRWFAGLLVSLFVLAGPVSADEELVDLILTFLGQPDKDVRALAFEQIRTDAKGEAATKVFAEELAKLPPDGQTGLLSALADRGDAAAKPAVIALLESTEDLSVKSAAIKALGPLGTKEDVSNLISLLTDSEAPIRDAARDSLVRIQGSDAGAELAALLRTATDDQRVEIIDVLITRRATDTIPEILKAAVAKNEQVRRAAMRGLGKVANTEHISGMVQGVLAAGSNAERADAEKAIMFVCSRAEDQANRAAQLIEAIDLLPPAQQDVLLSTLGRVGSEAARRRVEDYIADANSTHHSLGIRAISNWPDATVEARLLELARIDEHPDHRRTALKALIRIAPLPDSRSDTRKLDVLKTAYVMCPSGAEQTYVLNRARAIRAVETLRFLLPFVSDQKFKEVACESIVELAHHRELRETNRKEFHAALDMVIAASDNATTVDRAQRYKIDQTWVRPK